MQHRAAPFKHLAAKSQTQRFVLARIELPMHKNIAKLGVAESGAECNAQINLLRMRQSIARPLAKCQKRPCRKTPSGKMPAPQTVSLHDMPFHLQAQALSTHAIHDVFPLRHARH
jgi:hypothetical protein